MPGSHVTLPACAFSTVHGSPSVPTVKVPCEKLAPLKIATCIRRAQEESAHNTDAEMMEDERGDAIFVVAALDWCPRQAREPLDMLARMNTSLCIRHGRHARLLCSQPAGRQWSSHTMDIFDCTSRGQLHMVLVHAAVQ